jgi:hypothetical protein
MGRNLVWRLVSFHCILVFMLMASGCVAAPTIAKPETAQPTPTIRATATLQPSPTLLETETLTPEPTATVTETSTPRPTPIFPKACGKVTLGKPGTQSQDKTHPVLVQGTAFLCNETFRPNDDDSERFTSIPLQEARLDLDTG